MAKIPTVKLIGLSGSLALGASKKEDDIDVFVIAESNTVWLTRVIVVLFLMAKGVYRRRDDKFPAGKFCLNMIVGDDFVFPKKRHDLYTAHEIAQMLPLYDKDATYARFMNNNSWILAFLPNVTAVKERKNLTRGFLGGLISLMFKVLLLEQIARLFQQVYMGNITKETIEENILAFHPVDYRREILESYKKAKF